MAKKRTYGRPERVLLGAVRDQIDTSTWQGLDEGGLTDAHRQLFRSRKAGIQAFLRGDTAKQIKEISGVSRVQIYRLITERCLVPYEDGLPAGWRGLKPHQRLVPYTRRAPLEPDAWGAGLAGALQLLFSSKAGHELRTRFEARILRKLGPRDKLTAKKVAKQELIVWFLQEAESLYEVPGEHWPFNTSKRGRVTLSTFIDQVLDDNPERARTLQGGPEADKKAKAGDGVNRPKLRLLERTEGDGHKLDVRCIINVPNPAGGYSQRLVHRIWIIVIVDVASRCVIGYSISIRREPSKDDVLRAIRFALRRWEPRKLTTLNARTYHPKAGFPSKLNAKYIGACWNSMSVDGALANTCKSVRETLKGVVGAELIAPQDAQSHTKRRSLDDRPYIESFFRIFPKEMSKMSTGTGANPGERKGRDPEAAAAASNFQLEHLEDLMDVLVANYNGTPHSSLGYRTPLEQFEFLARQDPDLIRTADPGEVTRLLCARKKCRVLATKSGNNVHINFHNAEYAAEWLKVRRDLFGEYLDAYLEDDYDARFVTVSYKGQNLGRLHALPPWHQTPHTIFMRSAIKGLAVKRLISLASNVDPVTQLCELAEGETKGKLKVHPAYLEARRVFQHFAAKPEASDVPEEDNSTAMPAHKSRSRATPPPIPPKITPSTNPGITRRKAINAGNKL